MHGRGNWTTTPKVRTTPEPAPTSEPSNGGQQTPHVFSRCPKCNFNLAAAGELFDMIDRMPPEKLTAMLAVAKKLRQAEGGAHEG